MGNTLQRSGTVVANRKLAHNLFLLDIESSDIARTMGAGQFIHVQIPGMDARILRRPFSVYQVDEAAGTMSVLYQTVGAGTQHLASLEAPFTIDIIGPIGNCWEIPEDAQTILLVAGGVGAAPLFIYAQQLVAAGKQVDVVLGAQNKDALVALDAYEQLLGSEPYCATDDGSYGYHGFCTGVVSELVHSKSYDLVACCGPEPMMKIVSEIALDAGIPTRISLEKRMACGIGACLSCVVSELVHSKSYDLVACCGPEPMMKTVSEMALDADIPTRISLEKRMACGIGACLSCVVMTTEGYKRSCVDGPIFDAAKVAW